ncbi:MAG TPA: hypothetical protein VJ184_15920 [Chryseolinea sp.]|nr:hypothetical protein [Chryseolinea sp.]
MNRIMILMLCWVGPSLATGQTFNREQIVGVWTSMEVSFTKPIGQTPVEKATVEKTKRGLVNSQFIFKPNGLFFLQLPANAPTEFRELESMNNKMWHIKSKERMVFVGSLDEDLMIINVKIANGFYYFSIQDTPLVLKMKRNR